MIRRSLLSVGLASLVLTLSACPGDDGGGSGTETDSVGTTGDTAGETVAVDSTGDGTEGSTGEPAGVDLMPCDPTDKEPCEQFECAGSPHSGFYCRPGCSSMAEPGTPCGSDDVCLPVAPGSAETACFDVSECDFVTGEGCSLAAGDSCVVVSLDPLYTACVPTGDAPAGAACDPTGMLDCGPGLTCLGSSVDAGIDGQCVGWCDPDGALPGGCEACAQVTEGVGICAECSVLDDTCPEGSQCQLANELLGGACVQVGDGGLGSPCEPLDPAQSCQEGLLCVDLDLEGTGGSICIEPCDPGRPMCANEGESCVDLGVLSPAAPSGQLGVCLAVGVTICDPAMMPSTCDPGQNCLDVGGGIGICGDTCDPTQGSMACDGNSACFPSDGVDIDFAPFAEGNGACGAGCTSDAECGAGTCLHLDGIESDGLCGATCTPGMGGCGPGQTCVATPEDPMVGACMTGGNVCNLGNLGECGGGACVPLEGNMNVGICLPACFEQDPVACGGMPTQCQVKTDPTWHEGTCVGGGEPCSLVADDCGPGQACGILGGSAFGGQALLCDDAGPLGEGDACDSGDDQCGVGVTCIGGTCRVWCDPMAPACVTGVCTDVSTALYLPAGTLGACL